MDNRTIDQIKRAANVEVVRRLLAAYFVNKGFKDINRRIYPPAIQDLPYVVPQLADKVEIVPSVYEFDPLSGKATVRWNLFVLGNHRMFLGETHHDDLRTLAKQASTGSFGAEGAAMAQTTPRSIIAFITRVLGKHKGGYVDLKANYKQRNVMPTPRGTMTGMPQNFFSRAGYGT